MSTGFGMALTFRSRQYVQLRKLSPENIELNVREGGLGKVFTTVKKKSR